MKSAKDRAEIRAGNDSSLERVRLEIAKRYEPALKKLIDELQDQLVRSEAELSAARKELDILRATAGPSRLNAAFVEVARIVLAETTWRRIWERSLERAGQGGKL